MPRKNKNQQDNDKKLKGETTHDGDAQMANKKNPCQEVNSKPESKVENIIIEKKLISKDTENEAATSMAAQSEQQVKYENMNVKELQEICRKNGIKGFWKKRKNELIDMIENSKGHEGVTKLTVADFFCGAGGFSEGFNLAGFDVVFGLDNWKPAFETHELNHPSPKCKNLHMNILLIDTPEKIDQYVPDTDIIIGSPPCVSFSNSNKSGKADKSLGVQLIHQYLKIVLYKKTKPGSKLKYWIMENVPNSLQFVKDRYTAKELGLDESLPDLVIPRKNILVASHYGSPQGRKRAIAGDYVMPEATHVDSEVHIDIILKQLGTPINNDKQQICDPSFPEISLKRNNLTDHFYDTELPPDWTQKAKRLKEDHGYMGKMDFPDRINRLCRTIMATESYCSRESIIFPKENHTNKYRAPTIRELSCLMGFPIDYQFTGNTSNTKHKQIGNAVCVHMSLALGNAIKKHLNVNLHKTKRISHMNLNQKSNFVNLNDMKSPVYSTHKPKPKKMDSKFHIHVPYLKINQLRVELDNLTSTFVGEGTKMFKWTSTIHKGSGKNAKKALFTNDQLQPYIGKEPEFKQVVKFSERLKPRLNSSYVFQQKNCGVVSVKNNRHFAPYELLEHISDFIKPLDVQNESVSIPELDVELGYLKPNLYPMKVMYSLYILNLAVSYLE